MFHDLVHGDQIEAVIGKRQTFANARGKHLVFQVGAAQFEWN